VMGIEPRLPFRRVDTANDLHYPSLSSTWTSPRCLRG
jgi:hypothetical protein